MINPFTRENGEVSPCGKKPRPPGGFSETNEAPDPLTGDLAMERFGLVGQGSGFVSGVDPMLFAARLGPAVPPVAPIAEAAAAISTTTINAFVGGQAILADGSMLGSGMANPHFVRVAVISHLSLLGPIAHAHHRRTRTSL